MNINIHKQLARRKRRIERRLRWERSSRFGSEEVVLGQANVKYELSTKTRGIVYGGIGVLKRVAEEAGLPREINAQLHLLKLHLPYFESDHVLNIAFNALCEGTCLQDIELRRNDENFLDAVAAETIPDPTTAGDFCRRFSPLSVQVLLDAINVSRLRVWRRQPQDFFEEAVIDMDGTLVITTGQCKEGMDISYKKTWGYHPLVVTLANTGEVLSIVNRSGNRPSHEGAADEADRAVALCRRGGFRRVRLRGDSAFSQTEHLDRWNDEGVLFQFGYDAKKNLVEIADNLPDSAWKKLVRPPAYEAHGPRRARPTRVKREVVRRREFERLELNSEQVAEFEYRPRACRRARCRRHRRQRASGGRARTEMPHGTLLVGR